MIDGVWLRAALSNWAEADSESARDLLTAFVDARLKESQRDAVLVRRRPGALQSRSPDSFTTINPATGEVLATIKVTARGRNRCRCRSCATGAARVGRDDRHRARPHSASRGGDCCARATPSWRELETRDTGKPIQETSVVDVASGADCFEYFAGVAADDCRRASGSRAAGVRLHAARAARRRRRNRRLELSAADRVLEVRAGAGLRQCHDLQAGRSDAADGDQAAGGPAGGGSAAGPVPGRAGLCARRAGC